MTTIEPSRTALVPIDVMDRIVALPCPLSGDDVVRNATHLPTPTGTRCSSPRT
ncbi:hypothetical protein [Streptomyces xantholiticus]|uniref:hypothetical protein n=1 Tax=Streptomyces xantholiticus TaxID=68285 RepID=UPI0016796749|nr:hypothetical protein [Streptomyces xantholiticus]